jgi:tetratricopeptide (TPR) repeat protein
MKRTGSLLIALACITTQAIAASLATAAPALTVWDRAAPDTTVLRQQRYDAMLTAADDLLVVALGTAQNSQEQRNNLKSALEQYRQAIAFAPELAEAYFHVGNALTTILSECATSSANPMSQNWCRAEFALDTTRAREAARALLTFIKLAPLDPRTDDCLSTLATLLTKITGPEELQQAVAVYAEIIERSDPQYINRSTVPNLAEIYMMLGDVQRAITAYSQAVIAGSDVSSTLGLAVALDRAAQGQQARQLIRALTPEALQEWERSVARRTTYYVPEGEVHYYKALVNDAQGFPLIAAQEYDLFVKSGAHPRFDARAKQNKANLRLNNRAAGAK